MKCVYTLNYSRLETKFCICKSNEIFLKFFLYHAKIVQKIITGYFTFFFKRTTDSAIIRLRWNTIFNYILFLFLIIISKIFESTKTKICKKSKYVRKSNNCTTVLRKYKQWILSLHKMSVMNKFDEVFL